VAFLLTLAFLLTTSTALAIDQWYLEVRTSDVDQGTAARSVAVELKDIEVPGDPRRPGDKSADVSLHFRVDRADGKLRVTLWDRGLFVGKRSISDNPSTRVLARHVGLAAGELTHELRTRRDREARKVEQEVEMRQIEAERQKWLQTRRALGLDAAVGFDAIGVDAWLVGPQLGISFNNHYPLRLVSFVGWSAGKLEVLSSASSGEPTPSWSAWKWGLGVAWVGDYRDKTQFSLGGEFALSAVHVGGNVSVDGISGQRDTWGAVGSLNAGFKYRAFSAVWTGLSFRFGALLRRIPMSQNAENLNLGGVSVGALWSTTIVPG
jgi:hypothetical protein